MFAVHERSAVKNWFIIYVCHTRDGLFGLNLYIGQEIDENLRLTHWNHYDFNGIEKCS